MSNHWNKSRIMGDSPEGKAPGVDDERVDLRHVSRDLLRDRTPQQMAPRAETGIMKRVLRLGDEDEGDDDQDVLRTTAETRAVSEGLIETTAPLVMIVEDAFELAEILQITLRRLKLATVHESFGRQAVQRFVDQRPDIVLLDISLPDIPGWQVLEHIKDYCRGAGAGLPIIIVITAMGDPANRLIGKLQGVFRYLIKPFTPREVEQVVREALANKSA